MGDPLRPKLMISILTTVSSQEIERKAVLARDTANEAKKAAKEAKDLACETRFGGKILCIRPFGIGY